MSSRALQELGPALGREDLLSLGCRREGKGSRTICFTATQDHWLCLSCVNYFLLPDCPCYLIFAFPWGALRYLMKLLMMKLNQEMKLFFLFPLPELGKEVKISFFQERSGSCDVDTRPLCKLLCWSVDHPIPNPRITTSPWNDFSLPHLKARTHRSSADVYCHFLAGMPALNNRNSNSKRGQSSLGLPPAIRKSAVRTSKYCCLPTSFEQRLQDRPLTTVDPGTNGCYRILLRNSLWGKWKRGSPWVNT